MPRSPGTVMGIGEATLDLLGVAQRTQEPLVELSQFSLQGGGATATALATVAALGGQARYFGRLADGELGRFLLENLRAFGIDVASVLVEPGTLPAVSFIHVDEQTRRRTVYFTRGNVTPLAPADLPPSLLDGTALLLVDGHLPAAQVAAAEMARERGVPVMLDAGHLWTGMGELLALCDVVVASERFVSEVAPAGELEDSLIELARMGPRMAVITLGDAGAIGLEGDTLVRQNVLDVDAVDTTGAGDVFRGAFAYALVQGWPFERCIPFANAAAGLKCRSLGGQAGIPDLAEVESAAELD